ncbi:sulfatase-like hydrolase/transferase [Dyadobacter sp. CY327]|uniref:sulfatase-like hydrolase/transferase n=1 Tax=Dyadobacter sp. CY327 TaxID=2907301 RepID=UPI001F213BEA|nr:sulfatase-like hydrolase/transferase [Dyadobacter sp. CY327]MCE7072209.1 sulfatase-like hydrolase/transferase [Dyadobacter sp. CY327]
MSRHRDQPCFVNLWPDDVHTPWVPEPGVGEETLKPQSEAAFKRMLKEYDIQIGRLIDGLKARGLFENTIIIFTSDNGIQQYQEAGRINQEVTGLVERAAAVGKIT